MIRALQNLVSDPDRALIASMSGAIELAKRRYALDAGAQWRPGTPLKLLLAGYCGTRNTGADVRVEEMIRQFRHMFGDENLSLSVLTLDPGRSKGYFRGARQLTLPSAYPAFLFREVHQHHGVIACEGSMFKSKFANALSTMMAGSLGLAAVEGKVAVGYGGEAGAMDAPLRKFVRDYCRETRIWARNEASVDVLAELGIQAEPGTDTAWTFEPSPSPRAHQLLRAQGWDGKTPIVCVCPINAYWWPVRPSLGRGLSVALGGTRDESHYKSFYFHADSPEIRARQGRYLAALQHATQRFVAQRSVFPIVVGMEALDRKACLELASALKAPTFIADEYDMFDLVAIVREARLLVSSRYHAIVTSMPAATPSIGVTMDERITNLMADRGQPGLALRCDDNNLDVRLHEQMSAVWTKPDEHRDAILRTVSVNLLRMAEMGRAFLQHVKERHPDLPTRAQTDAADPRAFLPPLSPSLQEVLRRNGSPERSLLAPSTEAALRLV